MCKELLEHEIEAVLRAAISSDYAKSILEKKDSKGKTLLEAIAENIATASALQEEGYYNDDDIRFFIGREILARLTAEEEKTEYLLKAEDMSGEKIFKVIVPSGTDRDDVVKAFFIATKYLNYSGEYDFGFKKEYFATKRLRDNDYEKYLELGKETFDEHFEKMLEVETSHRPEIFRFYITECMGWEISEVEGGFDFEFEW